MYGTGKLIIMLILGVETSCDETAASVVKDGKEILSSVVASSQDLHTKTGGIIPENAARQQIRSIIPVIQETLDVAFGEKLDEKDNNTLPPAHPPGRTAQQAGGYPLLATKIDAIAVTVGPGLIGSLLVGVETAKTLSYLWNKPLVPINHLIAHIYANWIFSNHESRITNHKGPKFPLLALVVSGGHTDLVLMKRHGYIKWIGGTRDDAAGEAFDKCARLLGLPYPGGPSISASAEKYRPLKTDHRKLKMFPRPMIGSDNFDFSFSGLKTSVLNHLKSHKLKVKGPQLAAEVQEAIVDSLATKSLKAINKYQPKSFFLSGGVAANKRLRTKLQRTIEKQNDLEFHVPLVHLCTDNAAMIAAAAYYNYKPIPWKRVIANPQLTITGES